MEKVIGDNTYRVGKLNARAQFHVARRLAPLVAEALPAFLNLKQADSKQALGIAIIEAAGGPIAEALAGMPDADADYVIDTCLSVVTRMTKDGAAWAKVAAPGGGLMFVDIELPQLLEIVAAVIEENLGNLFTGAGTHGPAAPPPPPLG